MLLGEIKLICGRSYGRKAKEVYIQCCNWFGWDKSKANEFGIMRPLYGLRADNTKTKDIWFICSNNLYNPRYVDALVNGHREKRLRNNIIATNDGKTLAIEECQPDEPYPDKVYPLRDRIVFAKDKKGDYVFLGVYRAKEPASRAHLREFYKIADDYSIN